MDNWLQAPAIATLNPEEVHIWRASTLQPANTLCELETLLSQAERERMTRYRDDSARAQFVIGRGALRDILGKYLGMDPRFLEFTYGDRGKPTLVTETRDRNVGFNVSHSGSVVLLAFGRERELGIDVEQLTALDDLDAIADHFFTREEARRIKAGQENKRELFYRYWTRKEAMLKCSGRGIDDDCCASAAEFNGTICDLIPEHGYAAALAVQGAPFRLITYRWVHRSGGLPATLKSGSPMVPK